MTWKVALSWNGDVQTKYGSRAMALVIALRFDVVCRRGRSNVEKHEDSANAIINAWAFCAMINRVRGVAS